MVDFSYDNNLHMTLLGSGLRPEIKTSVMHHLQFDDVEEHITKAIHIESALKAQSVLSLSSYPMNLAASATVVNSTRICKMRYRPCLTCFNNFDKFQLEYLNPYSMSMTIHKNVTTTTAHRPGIADNIQQFDTGKSQLFSNTTTQQKVRFQPPDDFTKLFDLSLSTFTVQQRKELLCLLWEYSDVFLKKDVVMMF